MNVRHFQQFPKPYLVYSHVVKGLLLKKKSTEKILPNVEYIVDRFKINQNHLDAYNKVTNFKDNGQIPALYLIMLSQSLQMQMMTQEDFPFVILGLVHLSNSIKQYRKVNLNESLTLSCRFGDLQPHDKGMQFDFIITVRVNDEIVIEGSTTYLSRKKGISSRTKPVVENKEQPKYELQQCWKIDEDIGRRYARVSGDFNPIHLHALSAKVFGFKKAIAHGMWTNAKALANIDFPDAYEAEVYFKLPLYLPSEVEFLTYTTASTINILIRDKKNLKPHVVGEIKVL